MNCAYSLNKKKKGKRGTKYCFGEKEGPRRKMVFRHREGKKRKKKREEKSNKENASCVGLTKEKKKG